MLYLIGLGLYDAKDLSLRGLEATRKCKRLYVEGYTNYFAGGVEEVLGRKVTVLSRKDVEEKPEENVLKNGGNTCLLVPGDPLVATTHVDLVLRAKKLGIEVKVIHSSSVYSAIGETGLQLYKFGKTTTVAYPEGTYFPTSPYDAIEENLKAELHTMCLLDVKADEGRFMTVNEGLKLLLEMEAQKKKRIISEDMLCAGVARLGGDVDIKAGKLKDLLKHDFGKPPHVIVIPGKLHFMEEEALKMFSV